MSDKFDQNSVTLSQDLLQAANDFLAQQPAAAALFASMVAAQQLFFTYLTELATALAASGKAELKVSATDGAAPATLLDLFASAASAQAAKPFELSELQKVLQRTALPAFNRIEARYNEIADNRQRSTAQAQETKRRETPISIPSNTIPNITTLDRKQSIFIYGEPRAALFYLRKLAVQVTADSKQTILKIASSSCPLSEDNLETVPYCQWANQDKYYNFNTFFTREVATRRTLPLDILVVENIFELTKKFEQAKPRLATINEMQRKLRNFAKEEGALLISCFPNSEGISLTDIHTSAIAQHNLVLLAEIRRTDDTEVERLYVNNVCLGPVN